MYVENSLEKYLNDLAAKLPAPGGGSAAAMSAALGASLISMVVNFTLGKPKYAQYEAELKAILENSESFKKEFMNLVDLDVEAYQSKNLRNSLDVPFMVCRLCHECMKLCPALITKGNVNLISDVAVAAVLLEAAFTSAYFNVDINLKLIGDKELARTIRKELDDKEKTVRKIKQETEEKIGKVIRG